MIPEMLSRELKRLNIGVRVPGLNYKVNHLLYADDLILFGTRNEELAMLVQKTQKWATKYRLQINEDKTEVISLHTAGKPRIYINNVLIRSSNPTYLGHNGQ